MTTETIERGTSNVFADLGFPDPETHMFKAQLVTRIQDVIDTRGLTQSAAAKATGVSQPDVSRILRGQFRDISVERILRMLTRLGCEVDVIVRPEGSLAQVSAIRFSEARA